MITHIFLSALLAGQYLDAPTTRRISYVSAVSIIVSKTIRSMRFYQRRNRPATNHHLKQL